MPQPDAKQANDSTSPSYPYAQMTAWNPIYHGVSHAVGVAAYGFGTETVRVQRASLVQIDLTADGISFHTTLACSAQTGNQATVGQYISDFVESNPAVVLAINANFSWYQDVSQAGELYGLLGLAINTTMANNSTTTTIVCDPREPGWGPPPESSLPNVRGSGDAGRTALLIHGDASSNQITGASITEASSTCFPDISDVLFAVAGSGNPGDGFAPQSDPYALTYLVNDGKSTTDASADPHEGTAGRTAAGISADGKTLYLVTVEGREKATPQHGAAFNDIAQWLILAGAQTAVNLDGGGSTAMAIRDPRTHRAVMLTFPYGNEETPGYQRSVGNYLGLIAAPR